MQNRAPDRPRTEPAPAQTAPTETALDPPASVAATVALRSLSGRHAAYASEVERLLRAGLVVMRRHQTLNPRVTEIIHESGLSNQAFYRHFRGKDELLVAILDDGVRQLVNYLEHLMAKEARPSQRVRRWVEGVLAQAVDPVAADATRPFVIESLRLATQFPDQAARSEEALKAPLRAALAAASGGELPAADPRTDAEAIYHLAMGTMQGYLIRSETPSHTDIDHLAGFVLAGLDRRGGATGKTAGPMRPARRGGAARGA